jgi:hypothetical protein
MIPLTAIFHITKLEITVYLIVNDEKSGGMERKKMEEALPAAP